MRRLLLFLSGFMLLVLMCVALFFAGAIYDAGKKTTIDTYFFQPDANYARRPGVPASPADLGADKMRERLIAKYITEYFYVTPDTSDIEHRMSGDTSLRRMSTATAFETWLTTAAPEIQSLAGARALRTVSLISAEQKPGEKYWTVTYELKTWHTPNDFSVAPDVSRGILYLDIAYEPGMRQSVGKASLEEYLESGKDPAVAFRFGVYDIATQE